MEEAEIWLLLPSLVLAGRRLLLSILGGQNVSDKETMVTDARRLLDSISDLINDFHRSDNLKNVDLMINDLKDLVEVVGEIANAILEIEDETECSSKILQFEVDLDVMDMAFQLDLLFGTDDEDYYAVESTSNEEQDLEDLHIDLLFQLPPLVDNILPVTNSEDPKAEGIVTYSYQESELVVVKNTSPEEVSSLEGEVKVIYFDAPPIETEQVQIQSEAKLEEVQVQGETEMVQPEVEMEQVKRAAGLDGVKPEVGLDGVKPEAGLEEVKPEVGSEQVELEVRLEQVKPEAGLEEVEPESGFEEVKPEAGLEQAEPEVRLEQAEPEVGSEQAEPEVGSEQAEHEVQHDDTDDSDADSIDDDDLENEISVAPPVVFNIKSWNDDVFPIRTAAFFLNPLSRATELKVHQDLVQQSLKQVVNLIPDPSQRHQHFKVVDDWQSTPKLLNQHYGTNVMDIDSARFLEVLTSCCNLLFSPANEDGTGIPFDVCFLCAPFSGVVNCMNMFLDLSRPDIEANWFAFSTHPWKENIEYNRLSTEVLNTDLSKWRFLLNQNLNINDDSEVNTTLEGITAAFANGVDLLVADLFPYQWNKDTISNTRDLLQQTKAAQLTESGQIEIALNSIKKGGSLILRLMDPIDPAITIGNIIILCSLFSNVSLVSTRPSRTWISPSMLVCANYCGKEEFDIYYPNFSATYFSSIKENIESGGDMVMLSPSSLEAATLKNLKAMAAGVADRIHARIDSLTTSYENYFEFEQRMINQNNHAEAWMKTLSQNIIHVNHLWKHFHVDEMPYDPEMLQVVTTLWRDELTNNNVVIRVQDVLDRLRRKYMSHFHIPVTEFIDEDVLDVPQTGEFRPMKEVIPNVIYFSRFSSLDLIYDRMIVKKVGLLFPVTGFAFRVNAGIPQSCWNHEKVNVLACFYDDYGIELEDDQLVIECAHLPTRDYLMTSDTMLHNYVIEKLVMKMESMKEHQTLFFCRFPLFTRLYLAVVCIAKQSFEQIRLVVLNEERLLGVVFQDFKGKGDGLVRDTIEKLSRLRDDLTVDQPIEMEPIPLHSIMNSVDIDELILYNNMVLLYENRTTVNVLLSRIESYVNANRFY